MPKTEITIITIKDERMDNLYLRIDPKDKHTEEDQGSPKEVQPKWFTRCKYLHLDYISICKRL
jgi:hypothetical protein